MKFKLGQKVVINGGVPTFPSERFSRRGDIGTISEINESIPAYRVIVPGKNSYGSWVGERYLKLAPQTGEETQEYLKSIGMEDQMLRQLIMTMPINDVQHWYNERMEFEKQK